MTHQPETARELASLAVNAGRALQDEKRHYEIACQENAQLRAALARIRQMTDYWEQHLPEVIRTPAVVSALRAAMERAEAAAVSAAVAPPTDQTAALERVRALHQPMQRGPFTICAHCSGWDGEWRCRGVVTDYPCPTISALTSVEPAALRRMADETATETPQPSLRDQHRAAWHALTPDQQTARIAELDANDEPAAGARQDGAET